MLGLWAMLINKMWQVLLISKELVWLKENEMVDYEAWILLCLALTV